MSNDAHQKRKELEMNFRSKKIAAMTHQPTEDEIREASQEIKQQLSYQYRRSIDQPQFTTTEDGDRQGTLKQYLNNMAKTSIAKDEEFVWTLRLNLTMEQAYQLLSDDTSNFLQNVSLGNRPTVQLTAEQIEGALQVAEGIQDALDEIPVRALQNKLKKSVDESLAERLVSELKENHLVKVRKGWYVLADDSGEE